MTESRRTTVDTDPNNPYITLVAAPSQLLAFIEMAQLMERRCEFNENPELAQNVANRVMELLRRVSDRETGLAELIPDDLWESNSEHDLYGLPPGGFGSSARSMPYVERVPGYLTAVFHTKAEAEGWTELQWSFSGGDQ